MLKVLTGRLWQPETALGRVWAVTGKKWALRGGRGMEHAEAQRMLFAWLFHNRAREEAGRGLTHPKHLWRKGRGKARGSDRPISS